jgi:hypothetical protein
MSEQSTALRLADALRNIAADTSLSDRYCEVMFEADDELRRLHALNGELLKTLKWLDRWLGAKPMTECSSRILEAIAKAEGEA